MVRANPVPVRHLLHGLRESPVQARGSFDAVAVSRLPCVLQRPEEYGRAVEQTELAALDDLDLHGDDRREGRVVDEASSGAEDHAEVGLVYDPAASGDLRPGRDSPSRHAGRGRGLHGWQAYEDA